MGMGSWSRRVLAQALLAMAALLPGRSLPAQWQALGPQWRSPDSVVAHAIAVNHQQQVLVADVVGGQPRVQRFDGSLWQPLGAGLAGAGAADCALAIDPDGRALLALGPELGLQRLEAGSWLAQGGLPAVAGARDLQLRVAPGGARWLAWWQQGGFDSTFVLTDDGIGNWQQAGAFRGRLRDLELDEAAEPLVLLAADTAVWRLVASQWQPLPAFLHPQDDYVAIEALRDGADGLMALRRDAAGDLSVERYSGSGWQPLGGAAFVHGDLHDLAIGLSGIPHLAVVDHAASAPPQVFQFVAGSWQTLGGQFAYNNTVTRPDLAFDGGAAFLLYRDAEQFDQNTVLYLGTPLPAAQPTVAGICLYPNPASDRLQVAWDMPLPQGRIRIHDALGRVCRELEAGTGPAATIDISGLPPGRYGIVVTAPHRPPHRGTFTKLD